MRWLAVLVVLAVLLCGCPGNLDFEDTVITDGGAALTAVCADGSPCTMK
jgi:hypothetical protein